jgi:VanZ family protein
METKTKPYSYLFLLPLLWMALIFCVSHQSRVRLPGPSIPAKDKIIHATVYAVLGFLWIFPLSSLKVSYLFWIAWGITTLFGISDEFHQKYIPGRTFEVADMLANSVGAFFGVSYGIRIRRSQDFALQRNL